MAILLVILSTQCSKEEFIVDDMQDYNLKSTMNLESTSITIENPGFESDFTNWIEVDPAAISTTDIHSGSKAAKITGSGASLSQAVTVTANTDYELTAFVEGSWKFGVIVNSVKTTRSGDASSYEEQTVSFNSGSQTSINIIAEYNSNDGRYDDFTLVTSDSTITPTGSTQFTVSSVSASTDDGNVASNTLDANLATRWSGDGVGAYITYDLGSAKDVSTVKIATYQGDTRSTYIEIFTGLTTSSLTSVYNGQTAGNTLNLEEFAFTSVSARYIRIVGGGNSSPSTWNSLTEVEIWGTTSGGGDITPPAPVTSLSANANDASVSLSWTNPADSDFNHVDISYSGGSVTETGSSKTISGLTNGTTYTFTVIAYDDSGNASTSETINATPQAAATADYPSDLMRNYNQWKITYPDGVEDKTLFQATNEYFFVNANNDGIVFKAPIRSNNGTTPNSSYIRSELREREADGSADIYWTTTGTHVAYCKQAITHLPIVKDELVATQIHGNKADGIDDAMVLRLEGSHLFLSFNGGQLRNDLTIKTNYTLGTVHEVIFEVVNGKHYVYYSENGNLESAYLAGTASSYLVTDGANSYVMDLDYDQSYFKIGNYTQSNADKEGSETDNPNNYGEVVVYDFWVDHN
jgi:hypothetical protein